MPTIAELIHRVARGKHGAEHLSRAEARGLFARLLGEDADPMQLGAFLIAMRMKGETASELAGFVEAARERIHGYGRIVPPVNAVDLPCYAGKRRAAPVHLLAALRARDAGIPVIVHGISAIPGRLSAWPVLSDMGVKQACTIDAAARILSGEGIVYLDLADICRPLEQIIQLKPRLGVRTFAHTVARLLNPLACGGQINGFFHIPYGDVMVAANMLLGQERSLLFNGAEGEPELYADRQKMVLAQMGQRHACVHLPDSGKSPYPRTPIGDSDQLRRDFKRLLERPDGREQAVLARMQEAFRFAAFGERPRSWRFTLVES